MHKFAVASLKHTIYQGFQLLRLHQKNSTCPPRPKWRPTCSRAKRSSAHIRDGRPSLVDILNLVRTERATTRQELERESELGRAVVADRLGALTDLTLVDESELATATGGRAPRLVRFSAARGSILVATLDQTALGVGIADLGGRLKMEHHETSPTLTQPVSALSDRLVTLFRWILEMQQDAGELWGISISVPGAVADGAETFFQQSTPPVLPDGRAFPLVEKLVEVFDAPVWLRSSVETMTMGELHAGAGAGHRTMLFVKVGKRIGAGLVSDRSLFRGAQGAVGLIGSVPVSMRGPPQALWRPWPAPKPSPARAGCRPNAVQAPSSPSISGAATRSARSKWRRRLTWAMPRRSRSSPSGRLIGQVVATLANMLNPGTHRAVGVDRPDQQRARRGTRSHLWLHLSCGRTCRSSARGIGQFLRTRRRGDRRGGRHVLSSRAARLDHGRTPAGASTLPITQGQDRRAGRGRRRDGPAAESVRRHR